MNAVVPARDENYGTQPERVKLLLVDDDPSNLVALQAALEPLQQDLLLAGTGEDALRLCLEHQFAAVLLDVRMPDMDGFETAALIRSRKSSRRTPILFITAYRSDEQLFRGYDLGAVDFLFKPILPEILQSKVAVFVDMHRNERLLQRQAEQLGLAERRFRSALESAPDAMVITDESGVIELANSRTDVVFGYVREALIGRNLRDLIPEWQSGNLWEAMDEQGLNPQAALAETRVTAIRKDGTSFPAEITRSFFPTSSHYLITTAIRDATEQVEAEARIQKINAELEKRVAERTTELRCSNDALRQFAWAASHDLQEPVRTVLAFSQWLSTSGDDASPGERKNVLSMVHEHSTRLHQLLGGLRQYILLSELGLTSPQEEFWTLVDCNSVLRQVAANLQEPIEESQAVIERDGLPFIYGNDVLLVQLFQHLVSNAIKYRSASPPVIRISGQAVGPAWVFSVQDNGVGIDPKYHEYVFGIFRRLDRNGGAGMGLAICKAVIQRLGGDIWVESPAEGGSIFRFSVPLRSETGERTIHE